MIFTLLTFFLFACNPIATPEQPSVETIVAETIQALTAVPIESNVTVVPAEINPIIANGIPITLSKLSLVIPPGIATSITEEKSEASLPTEGTPWWGVHPTHVQYSIDAYNLPEISHEPEIYVYPIAEYIAINPEIVQEIELIKSLSNSPTQPLPEGLPLLPTWNASQMFYSNFGAVSFQNGSGIRYITEYSQFPHVISNSGLFYTFQGTTNDGLYYVSAILPINANFLVGYPSPPDPGDFAFIESEVQKVTEMLNNSNPEAFSPSTLTLDALIQSMSVTGIP